MLATLLAFPIFGLCLILQMTIFSRLVLLQGSVDLVLLVLIAWAINKKVTTAWQWVIIGGLMVTFVSGLPPGVALLGYSIAVGSTLLLRRRIWQAPLLAMLGMTFIGTALVLLLDLVVLRISGSPLPLLQSLNMVILPSILLNLILAVPIYGLIGDLAKVLYPSELQV